MQALMLSMLFIPAAPVPKDSQPERDAALVILIECAKDDQQLEAAIQCMGRLKYEKAIPIVREYLKHPAARVQCRAISALVELGAVDSDCLKVLRAIEKDRLAMGTNSPLRYVYTPIYFNSLRFPQAAVTLAPFFKEKFDSAINEDFSNGLIDCHRRFAHLLPGELDRQLHSLKSHDPAKPNDAAHQEVLNFAIAVRFAQKPPEGAVKQLERWWSVERNGIDFECAQSLLQFNPKNKVAADILDFHCRVFKPEDTNGVVRLAQILQFTKKQPELFAKIGRLAFTPGIGSNAQYFFSEMGRLGADSKIFVDDLERWTHTKNSMAKFTAMESLVRSKPELRDKYIPLLVEAVESRSPGLPHFVLDILISLNVGTPELKTKLELALRDWEPLSRDAHQAARALLQIDPENKIASAWIEARLKSWPHDRPTNSNAILYNHVPEMLTLVGAEARRFAPLLIALLKVGDQFIPYSQVIDSIEAVIRPNSK